MPAPLSPSSFFRGPSGSKTAHVLWVALANFLRRHSVLTKARASSADETGPPATAYFEPRSLSAFSMILRTLSSDQEVTSRAAPWLHPLPWAGTTDWDVDAQAAALASHAVPAGQVWDCATGSVGVGRVVSWAKAAAGSIAKASTVRRIMSSYGDCVKEW